ncbi:ATP-binding protein [uncultured Flavobacterium sp.]|uniref:sensor histidine kinase n=1 Tax=uncultured Flavobacterium sp. TaxID=165435 RepID=UPI0025FD58F2|nr:ATP-binding protein [uncultured Flavobacterium sp.]
MKIKTKLILALSLLFIMILALSGIATRQVRLLGDESRNILVANYQSMDYSRNMYKALDSFGDKPDAAEKFQSYLDQQMANITEVGEQELTADLQEDYSALLKDSRNEELRRKVRTDLNSIMKLNMDAIKRKSDLAENTATEAIWWISIASAFCFVTGFTLLLNLPGYIADPVRDLTESIRQIAAKNYSQRVHFKGHDEFSALAKSFNTMAGKLQEYSNSNLEKLMMGKRRIETLINNLSDPVIGLDEKKRILFINEEAIKVIGLSQEKAIGRQAEEAALYNDLLRVLLQEDRPLDSEPMKIYSDGKESYFEKHIVPINIVPTGEEEAKPIGSFIILKNITPYKELDNAKTNFIATVSHEFKTPIASMKMSLQLLANSKTGTLNDEQNDLVESLHDDTERLLRTTSELLNITQVETGKTNFRMENESLDPLIVEALEANRKAALQKGISIGQEDFGGLPPVLLDKEKGTWIISNLLSNAIRYSHDNDKIEISASATPTHVEIAITDHGIGIATEFQEKIFDKYFRVPGTEKEGTGLGLSISREFLAVMGGYIQLKSEIGRGSTFTAAFKRVLV